MAETETFYRFHYPIDIHRINYAAGTFSAHNFAHKISEPYFTAASAPQAEYLGLIVSAWRGAAISRAVFKASRHMATSCGSPDARPKPPRQSNGPDARRLRKILLRPAMVRLPVSHVIAGDDGALKAFHVSFTAALLRIVARRG